MVNVYRNAWPPAINYLTTGEVIFRHFSKPTVWMWSVGTQLHNNRLGFSLLQGVWVVWQHVGPLIYLMHDALAHCGSDSVVRKTVECGAWKEQWTVCTTLGGWVNESILYSQTERNTLKTHAERPLHGQVCYLSSIFQHECPKLGTTGQRHYSPSSEMDAHIRVKLVFWRMTEEQAAFCVFQIFANASHHQHKWLMWWKHSMRGWKRTFLVDWMNSDQSRGSSCFYWRVESFIRDCNSNSLKLKKVMIIMLRMFG